MFKSKVIGDFDSKHDRRIRDNGIKNFKIRAPLKHLSKIEITLVNCEINLIVTCFARYFIIGNPIVDQEPTFTTTDMFQLYYLKIMWNCSKN